MYNRIRIFAVNKDRFSTNILETKLRIKETNLCCAKTVLILDFNEKYMGSIVFERKIVADLIASPSHIFGYIWYPHHLQQLYSPFFINVAVRSGLFNASIDCTLIT